MRYQELRTAFANLPKNRPVPWKTFESNFCKSVSVCIQDAEMVFEIDIESDYGMIAFSLVLYIGKVPNKSRLLPVASMSRCRTSEAADTIVHEMLAIVMKHYDFHLKYTHNL